MLEIKKADISRLKEIVSFIDNTFTKEGYGFVTSAQIATEINRKAVWIALNDGVIVGVRVGINRVYNLAVDPTLRRMGIGSKLINIHRPETIRVKAIPVGHMSKKQKQNFKSPREFYKKLGYVFKWRDWPKNFWAGLRKGKRIYYQRGAKKHIEVWEDLNPKQRRLFSDTKCNQPLNLTESKDDSAS